MKAKKIDKKLVLNKKTVAHLEQEQMNRVQGGKPITWDIFCPPADTIRTCATVGTEFPC
jgi:hypothetical protein